MFNRQLGRAAYLIGITMIAIPLWDSITSVYPFRLGDSHWRFGTVGLLSNALMIPLEGLLFVIVAATLLGHRRVLRTLGVLSFIGAGLCLLSVAGFSLDALQSQRDIRPELYKGFVFASITACSKYLLGCGAMILLGRAAWNTAPGPGRSSASSKASVLIGESAQQPAPAKTS